MSLILAALLLVFPGISPRPAAPAAGLSLMSNSFANLQPIPVSHTCDASAPVSEELHWDGAPASTRSYALVMFDPDARPPKGFVHWVAYDIPASVHSLPSGTYSEATLSANGTKLGTNGNNGRGKLGFIPSCPGPGSPHHYTFTLYALSVPSLGLPPGATRDQLLAAIEGKTLAQAQLVGLYSRAPKN